MAKKKASRTTYHVVPAGNDWAVKKRGGKRASVVTKTKKEAVDRARGLAKKARPGQVVIHKKDGQIQEERTYGGDPYPPKG